MSTATTSVVSGLSLTPFRALRPTVDSTRLGALLCPPYDVIDEAQRTQLLQQDPDNAVGVILPRAEGGADPYAQAASRLAAQVSSGLLAPDATPALYVYEMQPSSGGATRGLLGAIELRDPADGIILPHENTMAGPVADRLALMTATEANVEPIYLVYDGGGPASQLVSDADRTDPIAQATTPDGTHHRLWRLGDADEHAAVATDLATRRALIADGHHRYATYRELQRNLHADRGPGPWDRGLTLLVDSSSYGPQVHAIHRVLIGVPLATAVERARAAGTVIPVDGQQLAGAAPSADDEQPLGAALPAGAAQPGSPALQRADYLEQALHSLAADPEFAAVLADAHGAFTLRDPAGKLSRAAQAPGEPPALAELDVTVLHRVLVEQVWQLADSVDTVGYAHSIDEAIANAQHTGGTAVLLRPTPVGAVAAVAAAGARMPRKSTLFTPKPASGLVMRRFADER